MKSHSIQWNAIEHSVPTPRFRSSGRLGRLHQVSVRAFIALVPAVAIVVGSAWLALSTELAVYLQAALWASGFVFMGLAMDAGKRVALAALATGIALPALAYLSSVAAIELTLVAAALVAAWVAAAIYRR